MLRKKKPDMKRHALFHTNRPILIYSDRNQNSGYLKGVGASKLEKTFRANALYLNRDSGYIYSQVVYRCIKI